MTFFIFQTSKLFLSPNQKYDLGGGRRLTVGTRVISATVEGAVIQGLPQGGEVETAFLELNVSSFDLLKRTASRLRILISLKLFIHCTVNTSFV